LKEFDHFHSVVLPYKSQIGQWLVIPGRIRFSPPLIMESFIVR
jgi:hypothetical protein